MCLPPLAPVLEGAVGTDCVRIQALPQSLTEVAGWKLILFDVQGL